MESSGVMSSEFLEKLMEDIAIPLCSMPKIGVTQIERLIGIGYLDPIRALIDADLILERWLSWRCVKSVDPSTSSISKQLMRDYGWHLWSFFYAGDVDPRMATPAES